MSQTRQYKRQIDRIVAKWAARNAENLEAEGIEKQNRWPSGASGGKGGQFAPSKGGASGGHSGAAKYSSYGDLFNGGSKFPSGDSPSWAKEQNAKPAGPPPGAKPHLHVDDKGKPVTINYPSKPSDQGSWTDARRTATFTPGSATPAQLHGTPLKPWANAPRSENEWANVPGQDARVDANHPFRPTEGKSVGAGVIIREPDGRIWLTSPTNAFGGYRNTFPKGTVEHGLSMQASAIKEAFEETGLQVRITGVLGDYERTTSKARFYVAERVGGTPSAMGWESQAIRLATAADMPKLLNMGVDKGIFADLESEGFFEKSASGGKKGGHGGWAKQERWPGGTPLGGQWKAMDGNGLTMPPTVAGGLAGSNSSYQKKMNAAYGMATSGQKTDVLDAAIAAEKKVKENEAKGAKSTHVKWHAQVAQYLTQLASDLFAAPKAEAIAERLTGPLKISSLTHVGPKPGGSNPGELMKDSKGQEWLVKGNNAAPNTGPKVSDDRARNEVLAAKLILAAGAGGVEMKLVEMEGQHGATKSGPGSLGVASKMVDDLQKISLGNPLHLAAVQKDFAVHAWLGNWDVLGQALDNTRIDKNGNAICIDPGGAILFRAQGEPKDAGAFDKSANDFETMRSKDQYQKSVYGGMSKSMLADSAQKLAGVTDETIHQLVKSYGPEGDKAKADLAETLIARRDAILAKAGLIKTAPLGGATAAPAGAVPQPTAPHEPPKISEAVKATSTGNAGIGKPNFVESITSKNFSAKAYYDGLYDKAVAAHAAGDMAALKAIALKPKGGPAWNVTVNADGTVSGALNAKLMHEAHQKLVADLEAKQAAGAQAVINGNATVTGADGTAWKADANGVLQPASAAPPSGTADVNGMKALTKDQATQVGKDFANYALGKPSSNDFLPGEPIHILNLATKGDAAGLVNFIPSSAHMKELQVKFAEAMGANEATIGLIKNASATLGHNSASALTEDEFDQVMLNSWPKNKAMDGTYSQLFYAASNGLMSDVLKVNIDKGGFTYAASQAIVQAMAAKAGLLNLQGAGSAQAAPAAPVAPAAKLTASKVDEILDSNNYVQHGLLAGTGNVKMMADAALKGDKAALEAIAPAELSQAKLKDALLAEMANPSAAPAAPIAAPVSKPDHDTLHAAVSAAGVDMDVSNWTNLQKKMWAAALSGDVAAVEAYNPLSDQSKAMKAALINALYHPTASVAPTPQPVKLSAAQANDLKAKHFPDGAVTSVGAKIALAAKKGDLQALKDIYPWNDAETAMKSDAMLLMSGQAVSLAPASRAASAPTPAPQPVSAPAAPLPAPPHFDSLKATSGNASNMATFNNKLAAIKAAFEAKDEKAILAMKFGVNTPNKQAAKVANDALAALGSVHQVQAGQDTNSHPALTGGTFQQPATAKPAVAPKATAISGDTSWVNLSGAEKIVEVKEQFGVKSALIEVPAKGYDPSAFGTPPDFFTNGTQGVTGKWSSSKQEVNEANNAAVKAIFDVATQGGTPEKLIAMQFPIVENGATKMVGIADHKAAGVKEYYTATLAELEAQLKPTYKTQTSGTMAGSYTGAARAIGATFKKKDYPEFKAHQVKAADYLVLSKDAATSVPLPKNGEFTETGPHKADYQAFKQASVKAFNGLSQAEQSAAKSYTGNSYDTWNEQLRKGDYDKMSAGGKAMVAAFAKAAQDIPEGSILWRGINVGLDTYKSAVGGLIQDGSFQSTSYGKKPAFGSKQTWLRIHVTKGVKALEATAFSQYGSGESEVIIQNNVRYLVLKAEHHADFKDSDGYSHGAKNIIDVIAIPHDA